MVDWSHVLSEWEKKFYPDKPLAATSKEWGEWRREAKKKKLRYFIANDVPSWIRSKIINPIEDAIWWVKYRTTSRYHILKLDTDPGYMDDSEKILYANFTILKNYVENDCAKRRWFYYVSSPEEDHELLMFDKYTMGIEYLNWEISLSDPDSEDYDDLLYESEKWKNGEIDPLDTQSGSAKEVKELYLWWLNYPSFILTDDDIYLKQYKESRRNRGVDEFYFDMFSDSDDPNDKETQEERELFKKHMDYSFNNEDEKYHKVEEMLLRLIKIRRSLWS